MSVLSYFPEIYDGEMLYSVLARYHRHVGNRAFSMTNEDLFGVTNIRSSFEVPSFVEKLAERINLDRGLTTERMIFELTQTPYYVSFLSSQKRRESLAKLASGYPFLYAEIGINASLVQKVDHFRFCTECCYAMMRDKGELWWKRVHHLPGVLVCTEHSCSLMESRAAIWSRNQQGFIAASRTICDNETYALVENADLGEMEQLLDIARASAALLNSSGEVGTNDELTASYRAALFDAGLMRSRNHVDVAAFFAKFQAHHGRILRLLPGVLDGEGGFSEWLLKLVRSNPKIVHPLQHVLLRSFLQSLPPRTAPFGDGPWYCRNPVAGHGEAATITMVEEKRTPEGITGVFNCECGYSYRMTRLSNGQIRGPRFRQFGPLFDPALTKLVADGATLTGAAKVLGVSTKAIAAAADRLKLGKAWKFPPNAGNRIGRPVLPETKVRNRKVVVPTVRGPARPRFDWPAKDKKLAYEIVHIAQSIRRETPPVRVLLSTLERKLGRRNLIFRRESKLPRVVFIVKAVCETVEDFQRRRIDWAVTELRDTGRVTISNVMRLAGVRNAWKAYIIERIAAPLSEIAEL